MKFISILVIALLFSCKTASRSDVSGIPSVDPKTQDLRTRFQNALKPNDPDFYKLVPLGIRFECFWYNAKGHSKVDDAVRKSFMTLSKDKNGYLDVEDKEEDLNFEKKNFKENGEFQSLTAITFERLGFPPYYEHMSNVYYHLRPDSQGIIIERTVTIKENKEVKEAFATAITRESIVEAETGEEAVSSKGHVAYAYASCEKRDRANL